MVGLVLVSEKLKHKKSYVYFEDVTSDVSLDELDDSKLPEEFLVITVDGMVAVEGDREIFPIGITFTSDNRGETLSFRCGNTMIAVPFEPITELIEHTRQQRKRGG